MRLDYMPSSEEINKAWAVLAKVGHPEICFHVYKDKENEKLYEIFSLILSMGSFNEKDCKKVGYGFSAFFKSLPRAFYQEGNPNNGKPLFDEVILHGDDYILLQARGFKDHMEKYDWKAVEDLVYETGKRWKADVHEVISEERGYGLVEYVIKFWWD